MRSFSVKRRFLPFFQVGTPECEIPTYGGREKKLCVAEGAGMRIAKWLQRGSSP